METSTKQISLAELVDLVETEFDVFSPSIEAIRADAQTWLEYYFGVVPFALVD